MCTQESGRCTHDLSVDVIAWLKLPSDESILSNDLFVPSVVIEVLPTNRANNTQTHSNKELTRTFSSRASSKETKVGKAEGKLQRIIDC